MLALAIWSVRDSPAPTWIAIILGVAASVLSVADALNHSSALELASAIFHAAFYFWAAGSLMMYMLSDYEVTTDELFAVGATFTLVAWAFAYVFNALQIVQPGSFTAAVNPDQQRTWMELLFLSFTNLSSTGSVRRRADHASGPVGGHDGTACRAGLRGAVRLPPGRIDHRAAAAGRRGASRPHRRSGIRRNPVLRRPRHC